VAFFINMTRDELSAILDQMALLSKSSSSQGEIPVIAALYCPDGTILYASNQVEEEDDPFSHAEINVLRQGLKKYDSRYLKDCILIVSLEPCLMCLGAIIKAGIKNLYYVLDDPKLGGLSHYHAFVDDKIHVHRIDDTRFKPIMDEFFQKLR
jgi:tRNA(adenine34) deaminase